MSVTWRGLGRGLAGNPERLALAVLAVAFVAAVVGGASAIGVAVHPAVGWLVVIVATGWPASWLGRRLIEQRASVAAADAYARGVAEGVPNSMRGDSNTGESYSGPRTGQDDTGGPPARTWGTSGGG